MYENEEDLIRRLSTAPYDDIIIRIINSPGVTVKVLLTATEKATSGAVLSEILNNPLLNAEIYMAVFEKNKVYENLSVNTKLLDSPYLNEEVFEYLLDNIKSTDTRIKLINSNFAREETCLKILAKYVDTEYGKSNIINAIMSCPHMSSLVLEKIIELSTTDELMQKCIESPYLTQPQFGKIVDIVLNSPDNYTESANKIFDNDFLDGSIILKVISTNAEIAKKKADKILNHQECNKETILKLLDIILNQDTVSLIVDHPLTDKDILKKLVINKISKLSDEKPIKEELLLKIINHKDCNDEIFFEIINITSNEKIFNAIEEKPNLSKKVQIALQLNRPFQTLNLDELLSIDGLTDEDYLYIFENTPKEKIIPELVKKEKLGTEVYKKMIPEMRKLINHNVSYGVSLDISVLEELIDKDIPESILCEIAKTETNINILEKIANHKNASMNVVAVLRVIADKFDEKTQKRLLELADKTKRKVIESIYTIEEEADVTEMLRTNVEDGLSTMLWGPSGVGKSSRVIQVDPTATMLILKNGMLPEEVIGGKEPNGEPGEIYPPHWYVVLCEKCKKEPDRMHILFIDEFTNVSDTIKNLVWEVIGCRLVNGHEEWPLPENCSIVVAGNRPEESTAVRIDSAGGVMPGPLHNRIDSMVEIKFDIDEWQKWALETDSKTERLRIHPIVYSFCVAHADKVMFSNYNPEDVTAPFLSPRKWETLSKAIYKAEERGELHHISNARIISILGDTEITAAFIAHYERIPINMDRIENGDYTPDDFMSIEDKLYALGMVIAKYEGDEMALEEFIDECLGEEYYSIYKNMNNLRKAVIEQKRTMK